MQHADKDGHLQKKTVPATAGTYLNGVTVTEIHLKTSQFIFF